VRGIGYVIGRTRSSNGTVGDAKNAPAAAAATG